jgi:PAS domain S-box-containing protein
MKCCSEFDEVEYLRVTDALAESEARFTKLFQASPMALAMSTLSEGRILDVNDSWLEMFGFRREEVIGRSNKELDLAVNPADRRGTAKRVREERVVRNLEIRARRKSGEILELIVSAVAADLAGGEEIWILAHTDITELKRAEADRDRLLESERAARAAAETALDRLRAIHSITEPALGDLSLDDLLQALLARLRQALTTDFASVLLIEEEKQCLYVRAVDGPVHERLPLLRVPIGNGLSGRILSEGLPMIVDDYSTLDLSGIQGMSAAEMRSSAQSVMGVPLRIGDKNVGVLNVTSVHPRQFTQDELKLLLVVADRVVPAIERARLVETVRADGERLKALSARLLTAQEEERRRLAVELHDDLGQVLTAVKINLQSLERTRDTDSVHLSSALASVDRAMERVRDLALDLRPSVLDDLGLPAALRWYADRFSRTCRIDVHLSIDPFLRLEPALETACFRLAQEAFTNVARHAQAQLVFLDLRLGDGILELEVRDDGVGFDVGNAWKLAVGGTSLGLLGMEERASLLGGELEVQSTPGQGTEVRVRFPASERPGVSS